MNHHFNFIRDFNINHSCDKSPELDPLKPNNNAYMKVSLLNFLLLLNHVQFEIKSYK